MAALSENYSLWIKPKGPLAVKLSQEISRQARAFAGPLFEPHVTLLPDIPGSRAEVLQQSQQLADKLKKFRINFLDVSTGATFHRCVYLLAAQEAGIMQAGAAARAHFGLPPADYMPHLSLLYGDVKDAAKAEAAQQAVQRLYGDSSGYDTLLADNGFTAEAISLWYTPVEDRSLGSWVQLGEFPLQD